MYINIYYFAPLSKPLMLLALPVICIWRLHRPYPAFRHLLSFCAILVDASTYSQGVIWLGFLRLKPRHRPNIFLGICELDSIPIPSRVFFPVPFSLQKNPSVKTLGWE